MSVSLSAGTLFYNGFRRAGILAEAGRGISASETSDALSEINAWIDYIGGMRGTVLAEDRQEFSLVSGQQVYQIGLDPAADCQAPAPISIEKASYVFNTTNPPVEQPFDILTPQLWQALSPKTLQSTNPYCLYYERFTSTEAVNGAYGTTSDMGSVSLWPVPLDSTISVALYLWIQIQQFTSATQNLVLPTMVQMMLETNLGVLLAARFPKRSHLSPTTELLARQSLARFKAMNSEPLEMQCEAGALGVTDQSGSFNLWSNSYNNSRR